MYFLDCLIDCLEQQWQYETIKVDGLDNYRLVSGVAIAGLLRAVAGLYVVEGRLQGRDLCALRLCLS